MNYFAITRRNDAWEYICSGIDPQEVYQEAIAILETHGTLPGSYFAEDTMVASTLTEQQIDALRVVPEETAREVYHVAFNSIKVLEEYE